jgi:hypothetical protein
MPAAPVLVGFSAGGGIVRGKPIGPISPIGPIIGITAGRITTVKYNPIFAESRKKNERSFFLLTPFAALYIVSHYENSGVHQTGM